MAITQSAAALVAYAARCAIISPDDRTWAFNRILGALRQSGSTPLWDAVDVEEFDLEAVMNRLSAAGVEAGVDEDTPSGRDRIETELMGLLMARPSTINERFHALMRTEGPQAATDWFYHLCCDARYVREAAIARNMSWRTSTAWGELEITINLSKPEKDPASIAAEGKALVGAQYPACQLCVENEGYYGRGARSPLGPHPARQNLRVVPIELGGETWGFQYSPYAYFEEHCITMSAEHRPMAINRANMGRLLDFIDFLPHYFVGSNADLPIVGGSILSHDHFQGGRHEFPMMRAEVEHTVSLPGFEGVTCVSLRWPLSVLRLQSTDRKELLDAACHIAQAWRSWNDQAAGVLAYDQNGTPHNTVTPIARRCGEEYELYLALRCNVTSAEHPLGVFHPHEDKWHIKKENIGLIEVMGMAILPPRLYESIYDGTLTRDAVGHTFAGVLEDAGVFKWDEDGRAALGRFLECL